MGPERDDFHKTEAVPDKLELIEKQLPYVGLVTISKLLRRDRFQHLQTLNYNFKGNLIFRQSDPENVHAIIKSLNW